MSQVYVARGTDGLLKIGRTKNLAGRLPALKQVFRRLGRELVEVKTFGDLSEDDAEYAERIALYKAHDDLDIYYGREWFLGSFDEACVIAQRAVDEVPFRIRLTPPTPQEIEAMRVRQEYVRAQNSIRVAEHRRGVEERKALREQRKREIAERVLASIGD